MTARQLPNLGPALRDDVPPPGVLGEPEPAVADEVDLWAAGEHQLPHHVQGWLPADDSEADWAMGMVRHVDAEISGLQAQARAWHDRIDAWLADATRAPERRRAFFADRLEAYGRQWREADERRRTLHLPSGRVTARVPQSATVVVADEAAVLDWLYDDDSPLAEAAIKRVPNSVYVSELRKLVEAVQRDDGTWSAVHSLTGEVVPGCAVEPPGPATYTVKPSQ